ncbi:aldo/keto reductase [Actinomadura spongiicola]|uniref:Aldo/keto reductase n=1 Tax=Actinomadura spongiicola TaxID=2303421 RepID=A0A372GCH4_9ACTN|nr:aldo/keto reductase [Actinomadura spongiicola]RFS83104.1 aldo/keto reductase [Actinomadura spongiicola]
MQQRTLGSSGLTVGAIGLGCMGMSFAYDPATRDDEESIRVINAAIDEGVTLIDTADVYGPFTNEELVGRALRGRRDEVVLASKCGLVVRNGEITPIGRPDHIRAAVEGSLRRLNVDVIDLYQLHRVDPDVPVEDSWGAMGELVADGKVRHLGISEATVDQLAAAHSIHPIAAVQSELSLWSRDELSEVLPWCREHDAAFIAYSPLGRGFLTGALTSVDQLEADDWRRGNPRFQAKSIERNRGIVTAIADVARDRNATPAQVALAWVLALGEDIVPIPGTRRLTRLKENLAAADLHLTAANLEALATLADHVTGDRY